MKQKKEAIRLKAMRGEQTAKFSVSTTAGVVVAVPCSWQLAVQRDLYTDKSIRVSNTSVDVEERQVVGFWEPHI